MADAYARVSGRVGVLTVHQGCGLTNAMTGITEAAKSRTPLVVLAAEAAAAAVRSNFRIDQAGAGRRGRRGARAGALGTGSAVDDTVRAYRRARGRAAHRGAQPAAGRAGRRARRRAAGAGRRRAGPAAAVRRRGRRELADAARRRPGGRSSSPGAAPGTRRAPSSRRWPTRCGALLATSAVAHGLFARRPVVAGRLRRLRLAAGRRADRRRRPGGRLGLRAEHVDHAARPARSARTPRWPRSTSTRTRSAPTSRCDSGCSATSPQAAAAVAALAAAGTARPATARRRCAARHRGRGPLAGRAVRRTSPAAAGSTRARCRSRWTTCCRPSGWSPSTPATSWATRARTCPCRTSAGFCFTQAFQSIGLGLASAIGAALARPDRLPVAALGDGGALMAVGRAGHRGPARAADGDRGLRRRRVRRRGAPLRPGRPPAGHGASSRTPTSPRSAAASAAPA